jgi:polysaccharide biosynthesis transport protein
VKVLAEIPPRSSSDLRAGTLRRRDLQAFERLLGELGGAHTVLMVGDAEAGRRQAAVGLATAAAATGTRTALLECDLAAPGLADALGLAMAPGLNEYLRGAADAESILKPLALAGPGSATATEPLVCVVAGRPSGDGTALLGSERLQRAVSGLRSAYELLVLDGPSLHDEQALTVLQAVADSTIACVGERKSRRKLPIAVTGQVIQV